MSHLVRLAVVDVVEGRPGLGARELLADARDGQRAEERPASGGRVRRAPLGEDDSRRSARLEEAAALLAVEVAVAQEHVEEGQAARRPREGRVRRGARRQHDLRGPARPAAPRGGYAARRACGVSAAWTLQNVALRTARGG